jgi:hypothetical protein
VQLFPKVRKNGFSPLGDGLKNNFELLDIH